MLESRDEYIIDDDEEDENNCEQSDFVSYIINLGYLKEGYAKEIRLNKGYRLRNRSKSFKYRSINTMKRKTKAVFSKQ